MNQKLEPRLDETDTGSPDDRSHYVNKIELTRAAVMGGKVRALCGVWFEPIRDPTRFRTCDECVEIFTRIQMAKKSGNN